MARLPTCQGVREHHNVLITGPTGIGNTWLGWALGHQACRNGLTALSLRLPRCLQALPLAQGDGREGKWLTTRAKTAVLRLDDGGRAPFSEENRRDGREIVEDRPDRRATMITSQLPVEHWHDALGAPTRAEAILDRLVPNAYKITLHGDSRRKRPAKLTQGAGADSQARPSVALLRRWQASPGVDGNFLVVHVAGILWTGWQESCGLGGRNPWNTHYPTQTTLTIDAEGIPHLKRLKARPVPAELATVEALLKARMPECHLLDVLRDVHYWAGYTRHFGPPSGADPKLPDAVVRYTFTVFGYACELGASQTARHTYHGAD